MKSGLLSGLSLNAMQGLLDPANVHKALLCDKDLISQAASAVERDESEGSECNERTAKVAAVAGSLIGRQYGATAYGAAGAALGGAIGGLQGAYIGHVVGEMYGP